ncbi:hypothetical protein [Thermicanus aegyptius]|uniref:hypothetical protein n=1 Tax=Thermicanus aegyptius TaxID=94009 RepID=UPI00040E87AF|nr:hypothetical protein [Thermicanus aegyptius]MBE3554020.1 hypothetical protein [Thermicanus sp.]
MKVNYPVKTNFDLKVVKEALKPLGGRCAKIVDGKLEYQIKEENEKEAYSLLKEKGYIE